MKSGLITRVERLEAQRPRQPERVHVFIQDRESYESALARYERDAGTTVMPEDLVIIRRIIYPPWSWQSEKPT